MIAAPSVCQSPELSRVSTVAAIAMPIEPPIVRARLKMLAAWSDALLRQRLIGERRQGHEDHAHADTLTMPGTMIQNVSMSRLYRVIA